MPYKSQARIKEEKLASCNFSGRRACGSADMEILLSEQPAAIPPAVVAAPKPDRLTPRVKHAVGSAHVRRSFLILSSIILLCSLASNKPLCTIPNRPSVPLDMYRDAVPCACLALPLHFYPMSLQQPGLFLPAPRSKRNPRLPSYSAKPGTPLLAPRVARGPFCRTLLAAQRTSLEP